MTYTCKYCDYSRRIVKSPKFYGVEDRVSPNSKMIDEYGGVPRCPHCQVDLLDSNGRYKLYLKNKEANTPKPSIPYTPKRKIN